MLEVLPIIEDMKGSAAKASGYCGKCCQCFRIWWEVLTMFQNMVGHAANIAGYCGKYVNVGSAANISGYCGKYVNVGSAANVSGYFGKSIYMCHLNTKLLALNTFLDVVGSFAFEWCPGFFISWMFLYLVRNVAYE